MISFFYFLSIFLSLSSDPTKYVKALPKYLGFGSFHTQPHIHIFQFHIHSDFTQINITNNTSIHSKTNTSIIDNETKVLNDTKINLSLFTNETTNSTSENIELPNKTQVNSSNLENNTNENISISNTSSKSEIDEDDQDTDSSNYQDDSSFSNSDFNFDNTPSTSVSTESSSDYSLIKPLYKKKYKHSSKNRKSQKRSDEALVILENPNEPDAEDMKYLSKVLEQRDLSKTSQIQVISLGKSSGGMKSWHKATIVDNIIIQNETSSDIPISDEDLILSDKPTPFPTATPVPTPAPTKFVVLPTRTPSFEHPYPIVIPYFTVFLSATIFVYAILTKRKSARHSSKRPRGELPHSNLVEDDENITMLPQKLENSINP